MKIEVGKTYLQRDGKPFGPVQRDSNFFNGEFPFGVAPFSIFDVRTMTGRYYAHGVDDRRDLVSEIVEIDTSKPPPAPTLAGLCASLPKCKARALLNSDPAFKEVAEALACKLAYALREDQSARIRRRAKQSPTLFFAACLLICDQGVDIVMTDNSVVLQHRALSR